MIDKYYIYSITVTGRPGVELYINNNAKPVIIGSYGMFRLQLEDNMRIESVRVKINEWYANYPLYIDLICEEKEGSVF